MTITFNDALGDPDKWSDEKLNAVLDFKKRMGVYPTREVEVCMGCGQEFPCKSDCPTGTCKTLV